MTPGILKLKRNDVDGAIALYQHGTARGTWSPEDGEMIVMLQDDPSELRKHLVALAKPPTTP